MVIDLMIHDFDYARWLAGDVERVYALKTSGVGGQPVCAGHSPDAKRRDRFD